jgi:hypothetical protein
MLLHHNKLFIFILFTCLTGAAFAQGPTDKVDVIKNFDAQLLDANKLKVTPTLPALDTTTKYQDYVVPPHPVNVDYDAPKLRPLGMKSATKEKDYDGFVKLGGGIPRSVYGEAGYGFGTKQFHGRAWARHHQANFQDLANQRFSNTDVLLNGGGVVNKTLGLDANVGYTYDRVHFYGYDHELDTFDAERVRQNFRILDIGARLFNAERNDADLNFHVAPKFYNMRDNYANTENGFDLNFGANKWFAEKHVLRLNIRTDFTTFEDTVKQRLNNIYLQPSFTFHTDFMRLKIGGNFASNRDVFHVYPDAELNLRVFGDGIQIFLGANGDLRKNTYRSMSDYNPFLEIRRSELRNTDWRNYFGGIRGNLGWLDYSVQGGYSTANNLALYQTFYTNEDITRFQVIYDTARIYNVQGTIRLMPMEGLTVSGTLSNNIYNLENEAPWGLPRLEGNFGAIYKLLEGKAQARANFFIADGISHLDEIGRPDKTGALYDLGIGGSYFFTNNIGVFLDINNLLNNKRERWYNYPMYGLNVLGGITARF